MVTTDPIADMFTRIRNAIQANHREVDIPLSRIKLEIARILKEEGYIEDYSTIEEGWPRILRIRLKYGPNRERVITEIKRVSKPGRRIYVGKDEIPRVMNGLGIAILSTSKGILSDKEARRLGVGGELIGTVC